MQARHHGQPWQSLGLGLSVALCLGACGAGANRAQNQPLADSAQTVDGISQSTQINQSTGGTGSSSVSTSSQVIDNGDGTVTIIETRVIDGRTETTRRTVKRSDHEAGSSSQVIQQQIN